MRITVVERGPVRRPAARLFVALAAGAALLLGADRAGSQQPDGGQRSGAGQMAVLGAEGRGAEGALVTILRQNPGDPSPMAAVLVSAQTAEGGVVQSATPRLAGLLLVVDHPRHLPFVASYPSSPPPAAIRLQPGSAVTGEVVASDTQAVVSEAEVCASWLDEEAPERFRRWRRCVVTGGDGRFELAGLPAERLQLGVSAQGFEEQAQALDNVDDAAAPLLLVVDPADPATADATAPGSAGRVLVEVIGADGEPVESFTMRVQAVSGGQRSGTAMTVEQTSVPAAASIPGRYLEGGMVAVTFEAENHLRSPMTGVQLVPGGAAELGAVFLESGAAVRGRIFDAVGAEPAGGCLVELLVTGAGEIRATLMGIRPMTVSDAGGSFLLGGLSEGRYHARTSCHAAPTTDRLVVLDAAEQLDLGEAWLDAGRRVSVLVDGVGEGTVRVFDRFKEVRTPIVETLLAPTASSARTGGTDGDSAAVELLLAPGDYRFEVLDGNGVLRTAREARIEPRGPGETQPVRLAARNRTIRSMLTMDGQPVPGGSVSFGAILETGRGAGTIVINSQAGSGGPRSRMFRGGGPHLRATVKADGSFVVDGAPSDLLWMTWFSTDGATLGRLWPEGALDLLDLGGTRQSGVFLDRDGRPLEGRVGLIGDLGREAATVMSGGDGRFALPPVPPGRYLLRGRGGPSGSASLEIELTTEAPAPQTLRVSDGEPGRIELTLRRPGGSAAAGAWIHLLDAAGDAAGTGLSSERGRFEQGDVPAGDVSLIWNDSAACVGGRTLTIDEQEVSRLELTLPTGRLLELRCPADECAGSPLSFLSVRTESGVEIAGHLNGAAGGPRFTEDGTLGLGCVTPDAYEFSFWTAGRRWTAEAEVDSIGREEEPIAVRGRPAGL